MSSYTKYTKEQKKWLLENSYGVASSELTKMFNDKFGTNISEEKITNFKNNHKLQGGVRLSFTKEQDEFLIKHGHNLFTKDLTDMFNRAFNTNLESTQIQSRKQRLGIYNHLGGRKITDKRKLYTEVTKPCGYTYVKVSRGKRNKNWELKQRYLYKKYYGEIPKGYSVIFANGDKTDFSKENLLLVENRIQQIASLRGLLCDDAEINKTALLISELIAKATEKRWLDE